MMSSSLEVELRKVNASFLADIGKFSVGEFLKSPLENLDPTDKSPIPILAFNVPQYIAFGTGFGIIKTLLTWYNIFLY